jgi:hypothetical protein
MYIEMGQIGLSLPRAYVTADIGRTNLNVRSWKSENLQRTPMKKI